MTGTALDDVQHKIEFSESGDDHTCLIHVTMPDNSIREFEATGATQQAARLIAVFRASFAIKCARALGDSTAQEQEAPAPSQQGAEASRDSSPKSLDVESRDIEPHNVSSNILADANLEQYSSSAEDDDDEMRVERRTLRAPIAFAPAPDTSVKPIYVDNECNGAPQNDFERSSLERSSLGDAESQHEKEVLDEAPSRERSREASDVEEGELESVALLETQDDRPRLTPQKREGPFTPSEPASVRNASPHPGEVPPVSQRRAKRNRSEHVSPAKKQVAWTGTARRQNSNRNPARKSSYQPSSTGNGNNKKEEPNVKQESTDRERRDEQPRHHKRQLHNAELPITSEPFNQGGRIPRCARQEEAKKDEELDMTKPNGYSYHPMYQHQHPPLGHMHHAPHPGQIHNPGAPFGGHPMYPSATPHPMNYPPQYHGTHMPHHASHMAAPYPPPVAPYATSPTGQTMPSSYMPQQGYPPPVMPHPMGGYPYQQPLPNGTSPFYHPHPQGAYHGAQHENQSSQRAAEISATATEVAAQMASEAAAKDAARHAKSDFEADQKAKRERQVRSTTQGNGKTGRNVRDSDSSPPDCTQNSARRESGENEVAGTAIVVDDGDQDDNAPTSRQMEDYVSTLTNMAQKGKTCRNLSTASYVAVSGGNGSRGGQQCTMSVTFVPYPDKEGIVITKTVMASRKKTSKQLVAKEILAEIDKRLEALPQSSDEEDGSQEKKIAQNKKSNGITTAVAALHRLYSLHVLCGPPVFKPEEPSEDGEKGLWKSVVLLDVKDFGKYTYEETGPSKKIAKQKCALKAFEALKEMKVPELEAFTHISKDGKDPEKNITEKDKFQYEEEDATPIEAIVDISDDDMDSNSSVDAELSPQDGRLVLPKGYKLVFPENESECEQWFKDNRQSDSQFGLFVDSPRARAVFMPTLTQKLQEDIQPCQPRFLCLSTATSGIVICFPEAGAGGLDSDSTDDSNASLPEVVVDILEDPETKKIGLAVTDGMSVLEYEEDFRARAVDDVALISVAITGLETVERSGPVASLPELTRHWLRKEAGKMSVKGAWREKVDIPAKLQAKGGKEIATGVLTSYACFCISQQIKHAARQKRTRKHGVAAAFLQLSDQVMHSIIW